MNDLEKTLTAVGEVLGHIEGAPRYSGAQLSTQSTRVDSAEAVVAAIAAFAPQHGWTQYTSAVRIDLGNSRGHGPILAGEYVRGDTSLHVRHEGPVWSLTRFSEDVGGDAVIAYDSRLETVPATPAGDVVVGHALRYRVFLRHDGRHGWRPFAARFTGYGDQQ
ncbi:hypothetical protein [Niveibacterium sp. COAC-50]|uniref:hypothetical protein n=1 Tax=Niveibacterium sp. COAC-50 TaxID=2729384 RepID=UPI001552F817|nr:hypothetical protein [Niveibacterium sp. COAC-50]